MTAASADDLLAQAAYSWASKTLSQREGFGFISLSPRLDAELPRLEAITRPAITWIGQEITTEQLRAHAPYRPVGRLVVDGSSIGFRKVAAGNDAMNRPGRYLIHFLFGSCRSLLLSDVLGVGDETWLRSEDLPLDSTITLLDLARNSVLPGRRRKLELADKDEEMVENAVHSLVRKGSLDVQGWPRERLLALIACMPPWFDTTATLLPSWQLGQPTNVLKAQPPENSLGIKANRHLALSGERLRSLHDRLTVARSLMECADLLTCATAVRPAADQPAAEFEPRNGPNADLVTTWLRHGFQTLTTEQRDTALSDVGQVFDILCRQRLRLPSVGRPDELSKRVLAARPDVAGWRHVTAILPQEDTAVAGLVAVVPVPSVLLACVHANATVGRDIEIQLRRGVLEDAMTVVVEEAKRDENLHLGLVRSVQLSGLGEGTFIHTLLSAKNVDLGYLFGKVIPEAFRGKSDLLLTAAGVRAESFVSWISCPEPYAQALVEALREEGRPALMRRISNALAKWSRRDHRTSRI